MVAVVYLGVAILVSRRMEQGVLRSTLFALLNVTCVFLIFFGPTRAGIQAMAFYLGFAVVFWILYRRFGQATGALSLMAILPPILLLVFSKATGLLALVGLSYASFRLVHLVWETRAGRIQPMTLPNLFAHLFFLPTFLLGPISPYSYFDRSFNGGDAHVLPPAEQCLLRILKGGLKVVVIAGVFLQLSPVNYLIDQRQHTLLEVPFAALSAYAFIYANFSGLNDVSIGAAGLMGIVVKENFNRPYLARSCTEFWNRWHISLSEWMRDLVFQPLSIALTRGIPWLSPEGATGIALFIVFILIGLWHGTGWQYLAAGVLFGLALVGEQRFRQWRKRRPDFANAWSRSRFVSLASLVVAQLYIAHVIALSTIPFQAYGIGVAALYQKVLRML